MIETETLDVVFGVKEAGGNHRKRTLENVLAVFTF